MGRFFLRESSYEPPKMQAGKCKAGETFRQKEWEKDHTLDLVLYQSIREQVGRLIAMIVAANRPIFYIYINIRFSDKMSKQVTT